MMIQPFLVTLFQGLPALIPGKPAIFIRPAQFLKTV